MYPAVSWWGARLENTGGEDIGDIQRLPVAVRTLTLQVGKRLTLEEWHAALASGRFLVQPVESLFGPTDPTFRANAQVVGSPTSTAEPKPETLAAEVWTTAADAPRYLTAGQILPDDVTTLAAGSSTPLDYAKLDRLAAGDARATNKITLITIESRQSGLPSTLDSYLLWYRGKSASSNAGWLICR